MAKPFSTNSQKMAHNFYNGEQSVLYQKTMALISVKKPCLKWLWKNKNCVSMFTKAFTNRNIVLKSDYFSTLKLILNRWEMLIEIQKKKHEIAIYINSLAYFYLKVDSHPTYAFIQFLQTENFVWNSHSCAHGATLKVRIQTWTHHLYVHFEIETAIINEKWNLWHYHSI